MAETFEISTTLPTSAEHTAFTGSAADIDSAVGVSFSAWDGYIQGWQDYYFTPMQAYFGS